MSLTQEQQAENRRIQEEMDRVRESKGLPRVDLSEPDPFKVTERGKAQPKNNT